MGIDQLKFRSITWSCEMNTVLFKVYNKNIFYVESNCREKAEIMY